MNLASVVNYLLSYAAYLLGASILILDLVERFSLMAQSNPDPNIVYKKKSFWATEKFNLIRIGLLGIVSVIFLPKVFGGSVVNISNAEGHTIYSVAMKAALIPVQVLVGWTGGKAILALLGKTKKELYKKVGIEDDK